MSLPNWENSKNYKQYDIIEEPDGSNIFYYAILNHTSLATTSGSSGSSGTTGTFYNDKVRWAGNLTVNGQVTPHFFWKPDFNVRYGIKAEVKKTKFGDGYEQRLKANIDNMLLSLDLTFSNRSYKEAVAILHFLNVRRGFGHFVYIPDNIYTTFRGQSNQFFVCKKWKHTPLFEENNRISCTFEQVPSINNYEVIR